MLKAELLVFRLLGASMKKFLVAGIVAAAALCSAPALAADYPVKAAADPMFNWSGFYIGVHAGGMDEKSTSPFLIPAAPGNSFNTPRKEVAIGGIHGGFQGQWGNFVLGVEGAWSAALSDQFSSAVGIGNAPPVGCNAAAGVFACQNRITDILSVGPRVGFAMGQWMVYGAGGYARAGNENRALTIATNALVDDNTKHTDGWYWGGGLEWLVLRNFTVGVDYKHYDFKSAGTYGVGGNARDVKPEADALVLRLTIK
jgi:outer membrane immunogenic protein